MRMVGSEDDKAPFRFRTNEPQHEKNNKMVCAPSEDSDPPGHVPSPISLRGPHEETFGPWLSLERTAKALIRLGRCPG